MIQINPIELPVLPEGELSIEQMASYAMALVDAVARVYKEKSRAPNRFPRSVTDLVAIISSIYPSRSFHLRELTNTEEGGEIVEGLSLRIKTQNANEADVYLSNSGDPSIRRYLICRQTFLLLPQHDELKSRVIGGTLSEEIFRAVTGIEKEHSVPSSANEIIADISAVEFLFPLTERFVAVLEIGGGSSIEVISHHYGIPVDVAKRYLQPEMVRMLRDLSVKRRSGPQHS